MPYQLNRHETWNLNTPPAANKEKGEFKIAGLNILTTAVTDHPSHLEKYPKYAWKNRLKPIIQLIQKDRPAVLVLSELQLKQAQDLRLFLKTQGYQLTGFNSETRESIEIIEQRIERGEDLVLGGEFVGFLYDTHEVQLEKTVCFELKPGHDKRILVEGRFIFLASHVHFAVLATHFDHLSLSSRKESATQELTLIKQLEEQKIPWFSVGDRNWFSNDYGQECAEAYISHPFICDFRDENEQGHYGPSGTFPGHLDLAIELQPSLIENEKGQKIIQANTIDVGFRSRDSIIGINDYAYTGEFHPETYDLLPQFQQGNLSQKNLLSDHYYIGGTFRFKT